MSYAGAGKCAGSIWDVSLSYASDAERSLAFPLNDGLIDNLSDAALNDNRIGKFSYVGTQTSVANDQDDGPSYVTKENGRMGNDMGDGLSYAGDGNGPAGVDLDDGLCYAGKGNCSLLLFVG